MAVPTGKYLVRTSVDLTPVFTAVEQETSVEITQPGRSALDESLQALTHEDRDRRHEALRQLQFFPREGKKIVAHVIGLIDDPDPGVRSMAIGVMVRYRKSLEPHASKLLPLLTDEGLSDHPRLAVAYMVAGHAPPSKAVETALTKALDLVDENNRMGIQFALDLYRQRADD